MVLKETEHDKARQKRARQALNLVTDNTITYEGNGRLERLDWQIKKEQSYGEMLAGVAEYKWRDLTSIDQYSGVYFNLRKYYVFSHTVATENCQAFFYVEIRNGEIWRASFKDIRELGVDFLVDGGWDADDARYDNDLEMCLDIPAGIFELVIEKKPDSRYE